MIDIKRLLDSHQIHWIDQGNNVAKGNINIKCPWCGPDDKSQHMGINLTTNQYGCWRNAHHRGKNIARLLAALDIYISEDRASLIAQLSNRTFFAEKENTTSTITKVYTTELPMTFLPLDTNIFSRPYINYLKKRGYTNPYVVAQDYDLRYSIMADKWSARLILPIYVNDWVTWTGRAIGTNPLRYLSPATAEATNIKETIFNYNQLKDSEGDILIITEGPFDAIKVDMYNKPRVRATCIFGLAATADQILLLKNICYNFNNIFIGLDQGTLVQSMDLRKSLWNFNPIIMRLPEKDLGDMNQEEVLELIERYEGN